MFLTEDALQFNLEAETEVEKLFVKTLSKHSPGTVEIHQGVNLAESQGGYIRDFGRGGSSVCAVTIRKGEPELLVDGREMAPRQLNLCPHSQDFYPGAIIQKCMECGGSKIS